LSDTFDVIMAAYQDAGTAGRDFDTLAGLVKAKTVASEGLILVEHDLGGEVSVTQTGDHLGRKGTALPRILQENGYVTGGFGKWHLTPDNVHGAAGPFTRWPQAWGFDHWWGFLSGAAGQYDPIITQDNSVLGVPEGQDGQQYYFPDDLTDKAVEWLHGVRAQDAAKPWFTYYSTGCAHAPHHVAKAWADK
jgi:arylsulfatase A-like enzyme